MAEHAFLGFRRKWPEKHRRYHTIDHHDARTVAHDCLTMDHIAPPAHVAGGSTHNMIGRRTVDGIS